MDRSPSFSRQIVDHDSDVEELAMAFLV